jgi:hypothetical protein
LVCFVELVYTSNNVYLFGDELMKKFTIFLLLLGLVLCMLATITGCSGTFGSPVSGNGHTETRPFDFTGFNRLEISNAFEVEITKSDSFSIGVTADSNLFEYLDIRKFGTTLHIGLQKNHTYFNTTQRAVLTMPDLRGLNVSGASNAHTVGFNSTTALELEASGASRLELADIRAGNTNIEVSGASRILGKLVMAGGNFNVSGASSLELEGTAENITADISGASSGKLEDFAMVDIDITVSGASNATITVSGKLDANVSGASRLYYIGSPTLGNIEVTGASTFHKK